ncbi:MAG: hypothetical protein ACHQU1_11140, partial [Gemmatimonadales bacterium]
PFDTIPSLASRSAATALRLDSSSADAWLAVGFAAYTVRPVEAAAALRAVRRAVALDSTNAEAWHFLGWLSLLSGQDSAASRAYRRALRIDPGRGITYEHLSRLAIAGRRLDEGRVLLDSCLTLEPLFGLGFNQRAVLRAYAGDVAGAVADAEQAARFSSDGDAGRLRAASVRAFAMLRAGDTTQARALADSLAPHVPHLNSPVSPGLGVVLEMLHDGRVSEGLRIAGISDSTGATPPGLALADFYFHLWTAMPYWDPARGNRAFDQVVAINADHWRVR